MRLLHITDFHYSEKNIADQDKLVDRLVEVVNQGENIDIILFSGDLVLQGGNSGRNFDKAKNAFLSKIASSTNVDLNNILICCGNHDVVRGKELDAVKQKLDGMRTVQELDYFVNNRDKREFKLSLENIGSYLKFQKSYYKQFPEEDIVQDLYTIHKRVFEGKRVGFVTINTAWRAFDSAKDRGNLLYPISLLKIAVNELKDCDTSILMMHHPISDFKEFVSFDIEDLIYNNFDFMFSGHVHKQKISTHISGSSGIFSCVSPASFTVNDNESVIGFSIVEFSVQDIYTALINKYVYNKREQSFYNEDDPIVVRIPVGREKEETINFRKAVSRRLEYIIQKADDLFLSTSDKDISKKSFLDLFSKPLIKNKSKTDESRDKNSYELNRKPSQTYNLEDIQFDKSNYLIRGKDKCGKTSLLHKIQIELLKNFTEAHTIPYYIDCREYKKGSDSIVNLPRRIARAYNITNRQAEKIYEKYDVKLLLDNYDFSDVSFNDEITSFVAQSENISFIICTEENISILSDKNSNIFDRKCTNLYVYDITRAQIRGLAQKWPNIPNEKRESVLEKINSIFNQLRIPCNYWNVSLFLWIFEKTSSANLHNNVDLIQFYIEKLLDKDSLALDKSIRINFEELRDYLGELAYFLINEHSDKVYSADIAQLAEFTKQYKAKNIRFVIDIDDILNLIIKKEIIKKGNKELYTFRLNGVFEYFLAVFLSNRDSYKNKILNDDHIYLSFANEFELYTGFNRKDKDFVEKIYEKTVNIFSTTNKSYGSKDIIDEILIRKAESVLNIEIQRIVSINEKQISALTPEQKDEIYESSSPMIIDNTDVELKRYYEEIDSTSENLEKTLKILSRVFRNSSLNDIGLSLKILDDILLCACHLGFLLLDESEDQEDDNDSKEPEIRKLTRLWVNFIPLIVQSFLFDALAQDDLQRLIELKIEEYRKDYKRNQYLLMLLYTLLIDLDPKKNLDKIDELIDLIDIGIIQNTLLVKLYAYLAFSTNGNTNFEEGIRRRIRNLSVKIEPTINRAEIDQRMLNATKIGAKEI
jgi:predicted MPP superfamily phosphohydrolase